MGARRYTELDAWRLADELRRGIQRLDGVDGRGRNHWLLLQLNRASQSACANIAEGFGRYHPRDFARFLRMSKGSLLEVNEHLEHAGQQGLVTDSERLALVTLANRAVGALTRLIRYLDTANPPIG